MLHPSYTELMKLINQDSEDDTPVINSRYSIVMATAKRARQIVSGDTVQGSFDAAKPLSAAVKELEQGRIRIIADEQTDAQDEELSAMEGLFVEDEAGADEEA